jgi:hypothetical protein
MALTRIQREILAVISTNRIEGGESYVAGGSALNFVLEQPRISRDLDLERTWQADRETLERVGFQYQPTRELPAFVEAMVAKGEDDSE